MKGSDQAAADTRELGSKKVKIFIDDAKKKVCLHFALMFVFTELPESFHCGNFRRYLDLK